jgi:hypothetical protein
VCVERGREGGRGGREGGREGVYVCVKRERERERERKKRRRGCHLKKKLMVPNIGHKNFYNGDNRLKSEKTKKEDSHTERNIRKMRRRIRKQTFSYISVT